MLIHGMAKKPSCVSQRFEGLSFELLKAVALNSDSHHPAMLQPLCRAAVPIQRF
jgi:hypothetical protein